jgi:ornithine cyclodeaminase/alanine dehydrogenase-like protein (mu-crystallin family)
LISISGAQLRELVPMADAVAAVRSAFQKVSAGKIEQPTRLLVANGATVAMLALDVESKASVVKALTIRPENPGAGRPAIQAVVVVFNGPTGEPEAVIEGSALTALRTGAAAGVGTDLLAAPDAHTLAVIGAGGQSADQVRAVCAVRPIKEVRIASRTRESAARLVERLRQELHEVAFVVASSNGGAIRDADVVCTVTGASAPLFTQDELAPNAHVNAMGAFTPTMCELPPEMFPKTRIVAIDEFAAARAEAGDLLQAIERGYLSWDAISEVGSLARQDASAGGWTVFKSVGIGAQDLEVGCLAVARARIAGLPNS